MHGAPSYSKVYGHAQETAVPTSADVVVLSDAALPVVVVLAVRELLCDLLRNERLWEVRLVLLCSRDAHVFSC